MQILIVSYFFPPDFAVGGIRPSSFCRFFPRRGIKVTLLTSNNETCKKDNKIFDFYPNTEAICIQRPKLRELGYKTKILVLLELLNLDKLLFFPDIYFPWIRKAVNKSLSILREKKLDAIIATAPPYSSFIVGYKLSKKLNVPLILDYRDPWSGNPFLNYPTIIF